MTNTEPSQSNLYGVWTRLMTRQVQFLLDLSILIAAFALAYLLRFEFDIPRARYHAFLVQLGYVVLLQFVALHLAGVHTFVWRYVGISEMRAFVVAAVSVFFVLIALRFGLPTSILGTWRIPLSICF